MLHWYVDWCSLKSVNLLELGPCRIRYIASNVISCHIQPFKAWCVTISSRHCEVIRTKMPRFFSHLPISQTMLHADGSIQFISFRCAVHSWSPYTPPPYEEGEELKHLATGNILGNYICLTPRICAGKEMIVTKMKVVRNFTFKNVDWATFYVRHLGTKPLLLSNITRTSSSVSYTASTDKFVYTQTEHFIYSTGIGIGIFFEIAGAAVLTRKQRAGYKQVQKELALEFRFLSGVHVAGNFCRPRIMFGVVGGIMWRTCRSYCTFPLDYLSPIQFKMSAVAFTPITSYFLFPGQNTFITKNYTLEPTRYETGFRISFIKAAVPWEIYGITRFIHSTHMSHVMFGTILWVATSTSSVWIIQDKSSTENAQVKRCVW